MTHKENKFIFLVRTCLVHQLCEFLYCENYTKDKNIKSQSINLLYCSKNITNIVIDEFIKYCIVPFSIAKSWSVMKQKHIHRMLINENNLNFHNYKSYANVRNLYFDHMFNISLNGLTFSQTLTHLSLGYCFNQSMNVGLLPSTLLQLTFGNCFNQPLTDHCGQKVLPCSLISLTFGQSFNQP